MRVRPNHVLPPKHTEMAIIRCHELILDAKNYGYDEVWIAGQMYGEFDADCTHIVNECLGKAQG